MIGHIKGKIYAFWEKGVIVDVNGVGYEIQTPASTLEKLPSAGQDTFIYTHLIWKEDSLSLYGFDSRDARDMFRLLLEVSGVGPRLALNILSVLSSDELLSALANGDPGRLQAIHGIGKKTAARLCVDLKERAKKMLSAQGGFSGTPARKPGEGGGGSLFDEAVSVLVNLGYRVGEARGAIGMVLSELGEDVTLEEVIKAGLKSLVKGKLEGQ